MKIEKLPSGSYRLRKTKNGKLYTLILDYKPGKRIAEDLINEYIRQQVPTPGHKTFKQCADEYIEIKNNVLSPSTIRSYRTIIRTLPDEFIKKNVYDITQVDIQKVINELSLDHKPKTVRNVHGFISSVIRLFRPDLSINTTLPQKVKYEPYIPTIDEVRKILQTAKGTKFYIPIQLGVLGLRRSEVCALEKSDLNGNELTINKALVADENNKFIVVHRTKTTEGKRTIYIPDDLRDQINQCDKICDMPPGTLLEGLQAIQLKLGIQKFRLHDLRHFYATYAHEKGMSDADIMSTGGWKSDYTMKSVYRHSTEKSKIEKQKEIANKLFS